MNPLREKLVIEAESWIGTPYISNGMIKGRRGGTDCAMVLLGIYQNVGLIAKDFDPRPYPSQWHVHQRAEVYLQQVLGWSREVPGPPQREPLGGDVVMFKLGGNVFCHGAIVTVWPNVIHAIGNDRVVPEDISKSTTGKRAFWPAEKKFFSFWGLEA